MISAQYALYVYFTDLVCDSKFCIPVKFDISLATFENFKIKFVKNPFNSIFSVLFAN